MGLSAPISNDDADDGCAASSTSSGPNELRNCNIVKNKNSCKYGNNAIINPFNTNTNTSSVVASLTSENKQQHKNHNCQAIMKTKHCCKHNFHTSSSTRFFTSTCCNKKNHQQVLNYNTNNKKNNKKYIASSSSTTSLSEASSTVDNRANLVPPVVAAVHQKRWSKSNKHNNQKQILKNSNSCGCSSSISITNNNKNKANCSCDGFSAAAAAVSGNCCCKQKTKLAGLNSFFRRISCVSTSLQRLTSFSNCKISKSLRKIKSGKKNISVVIIPTEFFVNLYELQRCQQTRIHIKIQYNTLTSSISSIKLNEIANDMAFHQYVNTVTAMTSNKTNTMSTSISNLNQIQAIKSTTNKQHNYNNRPKSADVKSSYFLKKKNDNFINVHDWDFDMTTTTTTTGTTTATTSADDTNGSSNNLLIDGNGRIIDVGNKTRKNKSIAAAADGYKIVNIATTSSEEIIFYDNVAFDDNVDGNDDAANVDYLDVGIQNKTFRTNIKATAESGVGNVDKHIYEDVNSIRKTNAKLNALRDYVVSEEYAEVDDCIVVGDDCKNKNKSMKKSTKNNTTIENVNFINNYKYNGYNGYLDRGNITTEL